MPEVIRQFARETDGIRADADTIRLWCNADPKRRVASVASSSFRLYLVLAAAQFFSGDAEASLATISRLRRHFSEIGLDPTPEIEQLQMTVLNGDKKFAREVLLRHMKGTAP